MAGLRRRSPRAGLSELARDIWPGTTDQSLTIEAIDHSGRGAHWRVEVLDRVAVFRLATSPDAAERVVAALEALGGEPFEGRRPPPREVAWACWRRL